MQSLTLEYSQCSSKCKKTFHMLRGFGPDAKRKKFEKTTAISWIKAQRKKQSKKLKIEKKIENRKMKIENRKIVNQSQNRKSKNENRKSKFFSESPNQSISFARGLFATSKF